MNEKFGTGVILTFVSHTLNDLTAKTGKTFYFQPSQKVGG